MAEAEVSLHAKWCKAIGFAGKTIRQTKDAERQSRKCLLSRLPAGRFTAETVSKKSPQSEVHGQTGTNQRLNKKTAYVIAAFLFFLFYLKITLRTF